MGKNFIVSGIILIIVAVVLMILVFSVADIHVVQDVFVGLYCDPGETEIIHTSQIAFSSSFESRSLWYCVGSEGQEREISNYIVATAIAVFLLPMLGGLALTMRGARIFQNELAQRIMLSRANNNGMENYSMKGANLSKANLSPEQQAQAQNILQSLSNASSVPASSSSLAERLKQLDEAHRQGLISSAEYDRTRQSILDGMDDNL